MYLFNIVVLDCLDFVLTTDPRNNKPIAIKLCKLPSGSVVIETVSEEKCTGSIEVEAKLVVDMAKTIIFPAASNYLMDLASTHSGMSQLGIDFDKSSAESVASSSNAMMAGVAKLSAALEKEDFASTEEHMQFLANDVCSLMNEVREHADALEGEVSDDMWPLAKYREMLFIK